MGHINIELKAKCTNPNFVREVLISERADFKGLDHQIDTYYRVEEGRLKLREGNIEHALVYYERGDQQASKQSDVWLYQAQRGAGLKELLDRALQRLVVVDKQREIYFIENVKFHIDEVQGLGDFVEIEAIDRNGTIGREILQAQCAAYSQKLGIKPQDLIAVSYSDLLLRDVSSER